VSSSSDILNLIDSAVRDWETSPDAVRYNAPAPAESEDAGFGSLAAASMFRAAAHFEQQMFELQHGGTTSAGAIDTSPLDQFTQHLREMFQQWTCFVCGTSWYGSAGHECNPQPSDAWDEHRMRVQLLKAYRVRPHEIGIGDMGCACHSAPFPAARDYRRRTKHRNHRRE
jgi:hypothetical protein